LLAMNLVSFEKYLREQHHLVIREQGDGRRALYRGRTPVGTFEDDKLSSITGLLVRRLQELFPEASGLSSSPLVQVIRGGSVADIVAALDVERVGEYISNATDPNIRAMAGAYDRALAALKNQEAAGRYLVADLLHKFAVLARTEAEGEAEELPFCTAAEYEDVMSGVNEDKAPQWPKPKGRIPDRHIEEFLTFFENDEKWECIVADDKKSIRVIKKSVRALDIFGLPATPDWVLALTHEQLQVGEGDLDREENHPGPAAGVELPAGRNIERPPPPVPAAGRRVGDEPPPEGIQEGIEHVVEWITVDPNKLTPQEKEICWYGFRGARKNYFAKVSEAAITRIFRGIKAGEHRDQYVIYEVTRGLRQLFHRFRPPPTDVQYGLMAGGCVVKRKTLFVISDTGIWDKKPSAADVGYDDEEDA